MKIVDRYLTVHFLNPFVYCLLLFLFLYIVIDLFGNLDEILKANTAIRTLLQYYLSFVPIIFVQTTPLAALIATSYSLGNLNKNNEITALRASGLSVLRIVSPYLLSGLLVSAMIMLINDSVVPQATLVSQKIKEERIELKTSQETQGILKDVTLYGHGNRMYYIQSFDTKKALFKNITMLVHDDRHVIREKVVAKSGRYLEGEWTFYDSISYSLGTKGQILGEPLFQAQKTIPIPETPEEFGQARKNLDSMSFRELLSYIRILESGGYRPNRELIALHSKIAIPFITFVAVLLGIPAVLSTSNRGSGTWVGIVISISMGLLVYGLLAVCLALGRAHLLPPAVASWFTNALFIGIGGTMLAKT
ncbi:MAG: LptF/LptG family permease [Candidatus Omnitrophica bacterium]|nr:LptF/LptG family permease [Candidatus Omnitrophota bacterium]